MWLIGRESTAQMTNAMPRLKPLVKDMNHRQLKCGTAAHHSQLRGGWMRPDTFNPYARIAELESQLEATQHTHNTRNNT